MRFLPKMLCAFALKILGVVFLPSVALADECKKLAADPYDPVTFGTGVHLYEIDVPRALAACKKYADLSDRNGSYWYARAKFASAKESKSFKEGEEAYSILAKVVNTHKHYLAFGLMYHITPTVMNDVKIALDGKILRSCFFNPFSDCRFTEREFKIHPPSAVRVGLGLDRKEATSSSNLLRPDPSSAIDVRSQITGKIADYFRNSIEKKEEWALLSYIDYLLAREKMRGDYSCWLPFYFYKEILTTAQHVDRNALQKYYISNENKFAGCLKKTATK